MIFDSIIGKAFPSQPSAKKTFSPMPAHRWSFLDLLLHRDPYYSFKNKMKIAAALTKVTGTVRKKWKEWEENGKKNDRPRFIHCFEFTFPLKHDDK